MDKNTEKNTFTIEEAFTQLDQIIRNLEQPDVKLADSMALYTQGVKLLEQCHITLDQTEKEIIILQEGSYGNINQNTDSGEGSKN